MGERGQIEFLLTLQVGMDLRFMARRAKRDCGNAHVAMRTVSVVIKIFISYRRSDAQWPARSLHDALKVSLRGRPHRIFMDVDSIAPGTDFAEAIEAFLSECEVILAVIGPNWLEARDMKGRRRLDDEDDLVRRELSAALRRGIRVVPVLMDGASMPNADHLPLDLRELARKNAVEIRHASFESDALGVMRALNLVADGRASSSRSDLLSYELEREIRHAAAVYRATFSADGTLVVTQAADHTARIFHVETGLMLPLQSSHRDNLTMAVLSRAQTHFATASDDKTVRLWRMPVQGDNGAQLITILTHHTSWVSGLAFSPDGLEFVTASGDATASICDVHTGRVRKTLRGHQGPLYGVTFSPTGGQILTWGADSTARLWDAPTGALMMTFKGHRKSVVKAAISADGLRIVTGSTDNDARVWTLDSENALGVLRGHRNIVHAVDFSPDDRQLVTGADDGVALLWRWDGGFDDLPRLVATLMGHADRLNGAAFSPMGDAILTSSADRTARLWDADTGTALSILTGHQDWVRSAKFSPDGRRIATASDDKVVRIWRAAHAL